ncbi:probable serine/threonine-protein kinase PBL11 isoform X1 [Ananas comosus]|uniref:non-specific serine/threonine protein kinase n=1 Tax=Ananas comosus TaxID=4615 RepID=A0A6P5EDX8_ANACO|nr:probable serine/threonine-protein kinase PBL11 isoform X1 [Ananas comosus]XP_020079873.1 probable serine/threonine-protein kinase PBL11 isoform X1 [Ananas comosus]
MVMWCFRFLNGEAKEFLDHDVRASGSKASSLEVSDRSTETPTGSKYPGFPQRPSNLRIFTFSELKNATKNFSRSLMVGEGGFGCVYRGSIRSPEEPHGRIEIAVKQLNRSGMQGHKEWVTEVNVLGVVEHPNLVKLIGYCIEDDERGMQLLLVYEYMPNGSVEDHLSSRSTRTLSWGMRLKIALDAARGLTYLHEGMDFQIIFRDFKTSNILLDENWNAKLSDFGLARQGPAEGLSHVSTAVVGTLGYAAPEYMRTGRLTTKSDIWSYGVVLYELITGRRPIDRNRPKCEQKLLEWVKPYISDVKKFRIILDPRLDGYYTLKSATKLATIANKCLLRLPKSRPNMSEVLGMVQKLVETLDIGDPQPPLISASEEAASREGCKKGRELKFKIRAMKMGLGWTLKLVRT